MSRHTVYRDSDIQVVVGFDRPLQEMYCQWIQYDTDDEEQARDDTSDSIDISIHDQPIEIVLADIWDTVREHGSVSPAVMDSVTRLLIKEMAINTMDECNRVVDWTKQIPTEGI